MGSLYYLVHAARADGSVAFVTRSYKAVSTSLPRGSPCLNRLCLVLGYASSPARAFDDGHGVQARPIMPMVEPRHIVKDGDGDGARFDSAVVPLHGLMAPDLGILEAIGRLLGHEQVNVLSQVALIAFQHQNVTRFLRVCWESLHQSQASY